MGGEIPTGRRAVCLGDKRVRISLRWPEHQAHPQEKKRCKVGLALAQLMAPRQMLGAADRRISAESSDVTHNINCSDFRGLNPFQTYNPSIVLDSAR